MKDCILCKIANNKTPALTLFESKIIKVVLVKNPISDGHLLIMPKKHFENIFDTPVNILEELINVSKKMSLLCKKKLNAFGVNILNASGKAAQQSVFHLHFHIVPRFENDKLNLWLHGKQKNLTKLKQIHKKLLS